MSKLQHDIFNLCKRNRDGSHATQTNRVKILKQMSEALYSAGYKKMSATDLSGRHVNALLRSWKESEVSVATIKNRMSALRWWAEKIGNPGAVKENEVYGIGNREYVTTESKALSIDSVDFTKVSPHISLSLRLQEAFGFRREEAMKFMPEYALSGSSPDTAIQLNIKGSWTKGGRERVVPVYTEEQRKLIWEAVGLAKRGSLIPEGVSYRSHLIDWEKQTSQAGIGRTHGLRHAYAQRRYEELTGFKSPAVAGYRPLSNEEKLLDRDARLLISTELGHGRMGITNIYIGSWSKK